MQGNSQRLWSQQAHRPGHVLSWLSTGCCELVADDVTPPLDGEDFVEGSSAVP